MLGSDPNASTTQQSSAIVVTEAEAESVDPFAESKASGWPVCAAPVRVITPAEMLSREPVTVTTTSASVVVGGSIMYQSSALSEVPAPVSSESILVQLCPS